MGGCKSCVPAIPTTSIIIRLSTFRTIIRQYTLCVELLAIEHGDITFITNIAIFAIALGFIFRSTRRYGTTFVICTNIAAIR